MIQKEQNNPAIQQAYDVLSDPQVLKGFYMYVSGINFMLWKERAWYDNHREQILRGGMGEKLEEEGIELFQFFSSSCDSGSF